VLKDAVQRFHVRQPPGDAFAPVIGHGVSGHDVQNGVEEIDGGHRPIKIGDQHS
jgi:hypothetical protein